MSEESKNFSQHQVFHDLLVDTQYAVRTLRTSREALSESKIGNDFGGKVPRAVVMHSMSRALTECKLPELDYDKFHRGVIALCLFFLEDDDMNLALKVKNGLMDIDK